METQAEITKPLAPPLSNLVSVPSKRCICNREKAESSNLCDLCDRTLAYVQKLFTKDNDCAKEGIEDFAIWFLLQRDISKHATVSIRRLLTHYGYKNDHVRRYPPEVKPKWRAPKRYRTHGRFLEISLGEATRKVMDAGFKTLKVI
jgi:hypothetical protein